VVTMAIESAVNVASTQLTLGGLLPSTTYYKYEDDFHNLEAFTTDAAGTHIFAQDITKSHIIFILPGPSTYFITDDADGGDCLKQSIGTWDAENKICTLIKNVDQTIQIESDGITLDGAGFSLTGSPGGFGIYLYRRMNVTIKNLTIEQFYYGILLYQSKNNKLTGNTLTDNGQGIYLWGQSDDNTLSDNNIANYHTGIFLGKSNNNVLTENTATSNSYGLYLTKSNNNVITENSVSSNFITGMSLNLSTANTLTANTADANTSFGISLTESSDNNTLTGNTLSNNGDSGLNLYFCNNNIIYNNNFIDNTLQAKINFSAKNLFILDDIFQADIGLTGRCTTDAAGQCLVGEDNRGKSLVVAKYVDEDSRKTIYITKWIPKNGYAKFKGIYMTIVRGP
jgi:parallel beta-helix repeat protein